MSDCGVLILGGPTASGKTALALALAERFDAEIVGADARQIYVGMPIGTATPEAAELARVRHHLVAFLDPHERYSAGRFVADALAAIEEIRTRGKRALVVGGTGFYLRALCGDVELSAPTDEAIVARVARETRVHPPEVLHAWLAVRDPVRAAELRPSDPYRIGRALALVLARADRRSEKTSVTDAKPARTLRTSGIAYAKVWLDPSTAALDARIEARTATMLQRGFVAEAERIGPAAIAASAVGYPSALAYLAGYSTEAELRMLLARRTRQYARRQRTWFRYEPDATALPAEDARASAERIVRERLGW